jgi:hypothetical protein
MTAQIVGDDGFETSPESGMSIAAAVPGATGDPGRDGSGYYPRCSDALIGCRGGASAREWRLPPHLWLEGEDVARVDGDEGAVMAKLIYASNMSLDGWTEDERGAFDWAPPDDDVFAFITKLMRSAGTCLYGRRMYETPAVWETDSALGRAVGPHG